MIADKHKKKFGGYWHGYPVETQINLVPLAHPDRKALHTLLVYRSYRPRPLPHVCAAHASLTFYGVV